MPTYEYHCNKCGKQFDFFQRMSADPLTVCPEELCGEKPWGKGSVKRLIGEGAGIIFKGSGFYCTDYKKESVPPTIKQPEHSSHSATTSTPAASTAPVSTPAKDSGK